MIRKILRNFGVLTSRVPPELEPYVDTQLSFFHNRIYKSYLDKTIIDFENLTEIFVRSREEKDSLRFLRKSKEVGGFIKEAHGLPERNLVFSLKDTNQIHRNMTKFYGSSEPYLVNIDDDEEQIKCTIEDIAFHAVYRDWPMFVICNRFVPGKPNRVLMKVTIKDWENSEPKFRGGRLAIANDYVFVNIYTEEYPRVLTADLSEKFPDNNYLFRDLQRDLPEGIELSAEYVKRLHEPIFLFRKSLKTYIYNNYLHDKFDATRMYDFDMATMGLAVPRSQKQVQTATGLFTEAEEEKIKKLAQMLGKGLEELKQEILASRKLRNTKFKKKSF